MAVTEPVPRDLPPSGPLLRMVRDQRVAFLIVGGFNTANGFALFVGFHLLFGNGFREYMATLLCAHVIAVLCGFVMHRRFVFRVRGQVWTDLVRFETVNLGGLAVNALLLPFFVEIVGLGVILGQLASGGIVVFGTYFGHSLFSFHRPEPASAEPIAADPVPEQGDS